MRSVLAPHRRLAPTLAVALLALACDARRLALEPVPICQRCHGGSGSAAPPGSVRGYTDTGDRPVGAHRQHLADGTLRGAVLCEECHVVPTRVDGHIGDAAATVTFGGPLAGGRPGTAWNTGSLRCENVYCHGDTLEGGTAKDPLWTQVDGTQKTCGSCHGEPPGSHAAFDDAWDCHRCHPGTVLARAAPADPAVIDLAAGKHLDGAVDGPTGTSCDLCHGAPPDTGAHRLHASPASLATVAYGSLAVLEDVSAGGTSYEFGCGHCHPLDLADHRADAGGDGLPDVVLGAPATPVAGDEIKARNALAAAWDPDAGTCSGVYCHSTGQDPGAALAYRTTPAWSAEPGALGCAGCHDDPPRYVSGGAGEPDANSHLDLDDYGWETGHFAGMAGPTHGSKHGGGNPLFGNDPQQAAAPITCQACHFETVAEAPGRFFFLDTTGDYRLDERPGADPTRTSLRAWTQAQCGTCHPPVREGSVLPLRHVNGRRDVVFDARPALPAAFTTGLPELASGEAVRPYYVSNFLPQPEAGGEVRFRLLPDSVLRPATNGSTVFTTSLESASWDPATKTCESVGCHLGRQSLADAGIVGPLRWGEPFVWFSNCNGCHNEYGPALPP